MTTGRINQVASQVGLNELPSGPTAYHLSPDQPRLDRDHRLPIATAVQYRSSIAATIARISRPKTVIRRPTSYIHGLRESRQVYGSRAATAASTHHLSLTTCTKSGIKFRPNSVREAQVLSGRGTVMGRHPSPNTPKGLYLCCRALECFMRSKPWRDSVEPTPR
jgi:hypothetical protein